MISCLLITLYCRTAELQYNDGMTRVARTYRIPRTTDETIKAIAKAKEKSESDVVTQAIEVLEKFASPVTIRRNGVRGHPADIAEANTRRTGSPILKPGHKTL